MLPSEPRWLLVARANKSKDTCASPFYYSQCFIASGNYSVLRCYGSVDVDTEIQNTDKRGTYLEFCSDLKYFLNLS